MTVRVKGVAAEVPFTASCSPEGEEAKVSTTVCGLRFTLVEVLAPAASVAVRRNSRYDGVLVVGGREGAARDAGPGLDRVRVTVRGAVLDQQSPGEP